MKRNVYRQPSFSTLALSSLALALSACATLDSAAPKAVAATASGAAATAAAPSADAAKAAAEKSATGKAPASAAAAAPPAPGAPPPPRPFNDIVKDAAEEKGFFTTWKKDDKVWIEIPEAMWNEPFFFSVNVTNAIGDAGIYGNQMGGYLAAGRGAQMASFKKHGLTGVQLIAKNVAFTAAKDSTAAKMVERSFSDSLIGNATIVSAPHPDRKSVLIEANALLVNDFPSVAAQLERTFRQPYAFDARNSGMDRAKNSESETGFNVRAHYGLAKLVLPPPVPNPMVPSPRVPSTLADVRSVFFGFYYGFSKMPEPMQPRLADPRVGYFTTTVSDFTDQARREVKSRQINRWRLEKKDPAAAISEPKAPIVFWLDKNVPLEYRAAVTEGVLEWNKAFETAGFKNALVVKQQGADDDFDTSSTRYASIRWVTGRGIGFGARGPSKVDPRTGEILDADIEMGDSNFRFYKARGVEDPPRPIGAQNMLLPHVHANGEICTYAHGKTNEMAFALDLLAARADFEESAPEFQRLVLDAVKDTTIHEVGHTLGLRHNFVASMAVTPEQLSDPKYGAEFGVASSTMDYNGVNLALNNERQGQYSMVTVGAYDKWAIEYGYKETTPETEKAELAKVLARATEPALAYATDEDAGFYPIVEGIDPAVNRLDLGNDPLAFYEKRFTLAKELWDRWQAKQLEPGTQYEVLRRNFQRGFAQFEVFGELAAKYVGGITVLRDVAGTGRQPLTPVDATQQRRALNLLTKNLFEVDSFKFKPEFLGKLSIDFDARWDNFDEETGAGGIGGLDFSVAGRVLAIQRATLSQLMRDTVAARLIGAPEKLTDPSKAFSVAELYTTLQKAVWSELAGDANISPMRRNLQREHARMMAQSVAGANPRTPADARSLQREFTIDLLAKLKAASGKRGLSIENRAHLNESIALLEGALKAQVSKALG